MRGWRIFAWDGPLDGLDDKDGFVCPPGLTDALKAAGTTPGFGNQDLLQPVAPTECSGSHLGGFVGGALVALRGCATLYLRSRPVSFRNVWFSWQTNSIISDPSATIRSTTLTVNGSLYAFGSSTVSSISSRP